jgi:hypothetical protein
MPESSLGLEVLNPDLISGFSHCALLTLLSPFIAAMAIASNFSAHSALACDGGLMIAGPANCGSPF